MSDYHRVLIFMADPGTPARCYLIHPNALVCVHTNAYGYACPHLHGKYTTVLTCEGALPLGWGGVCDRGSFYCSRLVTNAPADTRAGTRRTHVTKLTSRPGRERRGGLRWRERVAGRWGRVS